MGKGSRTPSEHSVFRDRATGAVIHQVTAHASINHPTYFLQSSFTPDGAALVFTSYRTGGAQLFEAAFPDGEIRQLTDGPPIHPYLARHCARTAGACSSCAAARSGKSTAPTWRSGSSFPSPARNWGNARSSRGEWLAAAIKQGAQPGIATGRVDGRDWRIIPFPRTVIHPQFHPLEPEWIEFSGDPAPRMHRVRRDGTGMECLHHHGNDEFVVHETFLGATGDLVFTIWPRALCRLDWTTREIRTITEFNCWHITPNRAGTLVLCDTNHPDEGLFLIDAATGARRRVCLSESSNQGTQWRKSRYALAGGFRRRRQRRRL